MTKRPRVRKLATRWAETVLFCGRCSKRVCGGFGEDGETRLDKALREQLGIHKGRKGSIGFVRTRCFDICPPNAVTVAKGSEPSTLYLIPRATPIVEVVAALGLASD